MASIQFIIPVFDQSIKLVAIQSNVAIATSCKDEHTMPRKASCAQMETVSLRVCAVLPPNENQP